MDTKIVTPTRENIRRAARLIRKGELVAFPTETVYGLGANAFDFDSVEKIFLAKGRPADNPLIVHIGSKEQIYEVAKDIPEYAQILIDKLMPGPLTLILKKQEKIPYIVTAKLNTVAVRLPAHPVAQAFLKACKVPIAAPSANLSTRPSPTKAQHVFDDLEYRLPLILDGGECEIGLESTVLDVTDDVPVILRPGAVTLEQLQGILGKVKIMSGNSPITKSPGTKYKHYSPKCKVLFSAHYEGMHDKISKTFDLLKSQSFNAVIFCMQENAPKYEDRKIAVLGEDYKQAAHNLFAMLREYENKADCIIVEGLGHDDIGDALINRLVKASGGQIL